jgi:hypothetical protein
MPFDGLSVRDHDVTLPLHVTDRTRVAHWRQGRANEKKVQAPRFWFFQHRRQMLRLISTAHDLIRDPRDWVIEFACDKQGRLCVLGALYVAAYRTGIVRSGKVYLDVLRHLERFTDSKRLFVFNDTHTHGEVMQVFDQAERDLRSVFHAA